MYVNETVRERESTSETNYRRELEKSILKGGQHESEVAEVGSGL